MKTKINKLENDWVRIKNVCRTTINKEHIEGEPSSKFKLNLLISEHSPMRLLKVNWIWKGIKSWVSVHFARHHIGIEKWIGTQRTDRTGVDRNELPQGALVNFEAEANSQALINMAKVRLCDKASPETREYFEDLKMVIYKMKTEPELFQVLVPSCIYRCGCPEFNQCAFFKKFMKLYPDINMFDIKERYEAYNSYFLSMKEN